MIKKRRVKRQQLEERGVRHGKSTVDNNIEAAWVSKAITVGRNVARLLSKTYCALDKNITHQPELPIRGFNWYLLNWALHFPLLQPSEA